MKQIKERLFMDRKIYHGSDMIVRAPRFGAGNAYNDFGLGFYCTGNVQCASEWAVGRDRSGFVSAYSIKMDGLRIINLCSSQYTPLHWLSLLLSFRDFDTPSAEAHRAIEYINKNYPVDYQGSDCIIGYRADDACFACARGFLLGEISYQGLDRFLRGSDANRQFVLKSNRAFDRISFTSYETAMAGDHYPAFVSREIRALRSMDKARNDKELYVDQMVREEVTAYDPRLR